jgi:hypothetical protein
MLIAAPYAVDLYETPILDLEVETDIAAIRGNYPAHGTSFAKTLAQPALPKGTAIASPAFSRHRVRPFVPDTSPTR